MKKIPILICWMAIGLMAHSQQIISLEDGSLSQDIVPTVPTRDVEEVSDGLIVKYVFKNALLLPDQLFENTYWWRVDGFGISDNPTEPSVLSRMDQFAIPDGKTANVQLVSCDYADYNYALTPAREPLPDDGEQQFTNSTIQPIAISDSWFPTNAIDVIDTQFYRGVGILNVKVSPIQYNSQKEQVRAFKEITYKVTFSDAISTYSAVKTKPTISANDPFLQTVTLNGYTSEFKWADTDPIEQEGYLIISVPKYADAVYAFAEWKKLLGFNVHVAIKDNWTPETVKSQVQSIYNSDKNLYYLLIVGDHQDVPSNKSTLRRIHVTDLPYAQLDYENDRMYDIYCGRLPVSNETEATIVVNKIINYEKYPVTESSFYSKGVNCAYFQDRDDPSVPTKRDGFADRRFAQTSEDVRNYLIGLGKSVQRIYYTEENVFPTNWNKGLFSIGEKIPEDLLKPTFAWNGNANDITNAVNKGAFYVLHRDHGNIYKWGDPEYTTSNIDQLTNGNKLPIVFSMNCQTGKFDAPICFCEKFLRKESGGCVAIIGASETSYSGHNDVLTCGMFDAIWPTPGLSIDMPSIDPNKAKPTPTPTFRLGQILNQGKIRMSDIYSDNELAQYTKEIFHCFGDPSMFFPTSAPTSFSNVRCLMGTDKLTVYNSNGSSIVTFYDLVTGDTKSYKCSIASYTTANPRNVSICISGHNKIPYVLNGTPPPITYIQNETITGPISISDETIIIGSNVTDTKEEGPVIFDGGDITIGGSEVQINPNTTVTKNTTFKITIK